MRGERLAVGRPPSSLPRWLVRLLLALLLAGLGLALLRVGAPPSVTIAPALPGVGPRTAITIELAASGRGLGDVVVELQQGDRIETLARREHRPRPFWAFWGSRTRSDAFTVEVGTRVQAGLEAGTATIRVSAERAATWLRRPAPVVAELELPVRVLPPSLAVTSSLHYVSQGGSGLVVYRVGSGALRDGVRAGDKWFPGFPLPGADPLRRFCLFGLPYDLEDPTRVRLLAVDDVGNERAVDFLDGFAPQPLRSGTIELDDDFMARVVPEILAAGADGLVASGDLLRSYLLLNGELRRRNAERLMRLAAGSRAELLWRGVFAQLPNSQVMSPFAVRRSYSYRGETVDRQDHLGFDLASRRRAPVPAANRGVVVLAEYLGIYGQSVVLDHGYGLMSLYSHLSQIGVAVGTLVERGEILGQTGMTGLAGGDHLHFSMLLHGLPVSPLEWWDATWVEERIVRKLAEAGALGQR